MPGIAEYSNSDPVRLESLQEKLLAVCRQVGIQSTMPQRTKSAKALTERVTEQDLANAEQALMSAQMAGVKTCHVIC